MKGNIFRVPRHISVCDRSNETTSFIQFFFFLWVWERIYIKRDLIFLLIAKIMANGTFNIRIGYIHYKNTFTESIKIVRKLYYGGN